MVLPGTRRAYTGVARPGTRPGRPCAGLLDPFLSCTRVCQSAGSSSRFAAVSQAEGSLSQAEGSLSQAEGQPL
eukprot:3457030-Rhodomonas_salina.1